MDNEWNLGQTYAFCWSVNTGVKPCANLCVQRYYSKDIMDYIASEYPGLTVYVKDNGLENYIDIYVYKYSHIKDVIDALEYIPEPVIHWYQGKLFGISDLEIEGFIANDKEEL